jgi:hypothetical protein
MDIVSVDRDPLPVMLTSEAGDVTEAAPRAFERLEKALPSMKGRKFYGYWDPAAKEYRACVVADAADDPAALGLDRGELPGGRYLRSRLRGEPAELYPRIGPTFERMSAAEPSLDPSRPWIEFYRARDEVVLLLPVTG